MLCGTAPEVSVLSAALSPAVEAAVIAALAAIVVAAVGGLLAFVDRGLQRRRDLYSRAYRSAMAWKEMLYRVRRRAPGAEADRKLVETFHSLQEEIDYYQGWICSESPWLGRSYCKLVAAVKKDTLKPIADAWAESPRRAPSAGTLPNDFHPNVERASHSFLLDVRLHLSILIFPRLVVVWRNRKSPEATT
jgi:hypothetical protein